MQLVSLAFAMGLIALIENSTALATVTGPGLVSGSARLSPVTAGVKENDEPSENRQPGTERSSLMSIRYSQV